MKTIIKKFFVTLAVFSAVFGGVSFLSPEPTHAVEAFTGSCRDFLGFKSWDCGVVFSDSGDTSFEDSIKNNLWTIAANVATDITVLAAYLVIGYVIYGGYQYVFSSGDPGKVAKARKTLAHAFIGLAIAMSATIIMNSIRIALVGGATGNLGKCVSEDGCVDPGTMVTNAIQWTVGAVGIVAAIFVVYGGISYISSRGESGKIIKARQTIIYALIGLIICALAEIITAWVSNTIRDANSGSIINHNIIVKEIHEQNH